MTPFSSIYARFLRKINDIQLANTFITDVNLAEEEIYGWLESSIIRFQRCKTNLQDRDLSSKQFNNKLSEYEEEVLARFMLCEWIAPFVNNVLSLKEFMQDGEFKIFSQGNFLKAKMDLQNDLESKAETMMNNYVTDTNDFSKLG